LLNGQTEEKQISIAEGDKQWIQFNFTDVKPDIVNETKYFCMISVESSSGNLKLMAKSNEPGYGIYKTISYDSTLPDSLTGESSSSYHRSIYCSYTIIHENNTPILSDESPVDGGVGVGLWPACSVRVSDADLDDLSVLFFENSSGSWVLQESVVGVGSGDVVVWGNFSSASVFDTVYWWRVCVFDGVFGRMRLIVLLLRMVFLIMIRMFRLFHLVL